MVREFEGRTEKEAIDLAIAELRLEAGEFDVEVLEESRGSIFKKGAVRIRVHVDDARSGVDLDEGPDPYNRAPQEEASVPDVDGNTIDAAVDRFGNTATGVGPTVEGIPLESTDAESKIAEFVSGVIQRMGYSGRVSLRRREEQKVVFNIESASSAILIGRKGKNLDALQLIANVFSGPRSGGPRVVLDTENYRARREENLKRLAHKSAEQVRRSRSSQLLEPMNPFERRIVHSALNEMHEVTTESEGEGLYKQVRVIYTG